MKLSLVLAFLAAVCSASAQVPQWYTTHTHRAHQPDLYIIGVGAAEGTNAMEKAKKNAQADIVSQIKVQVKNEIRTITESYQLNQEESISSEFRSQSRTVVNEEITGAAIVETFVDPETQTAYALAALDRTQYCEGLRTDMNGAWNQAAELRNTAADYLKRGKFSDAVHAVADARNLIVAALPKKALHDAVAGKSYTPPDPSTPMSLTSDMKTMISKVRMEKIKGDKQTGKIGTRFTEPFTVRALYDATPISGAQLVFESTDYMALGEAVTDAQGEASFTAHIRMLPGNTLRVKLTLAELSKEFDRNLVAAAAAFTYAPHLSDLGFEVSAKAVQGPASEALKGRVASAVSKVGYRVANGSRYRLELVMQHAPFVKTEGFSGALNTVKIETVVSLLDTQTGATLGTYTASATGGGRTEQDALAKAAAAVTIDSMKLADLLEKVAQ